MSWNAEEKSVSESFIVTVRCPEQPGIVLALSSFLVDHECDITEHQQFDDAESGHLFARTCFRSSNPDVTQDVLERDFAQLANSLSMDWGLYGTTTRERILVLVSKVDHCLNDLLYRWRTGTLAAELVGVVSNHETLKRMTEAAGLPFVHIPVTAETKAAAEQQLLDVVEELDVDTLVLARYMQILSDDLAKRLDGRAINIHHSFLPSFAGAKPYHQAYARGVKLVGATAHYVTGDLDEGPIIAQVVAEIDHRSNADDLVRVGRDSECAALARAVQWHAEHRILLNGNRTVIFK
jgi:formyltetrahydrofolate deformylase